MKEVSTNKWIRFAFPLGLLCSGFLLTMIGLSLLTVQDCWVLIMAIGIVKMILTL
jgi:hypothetical protein